MCGSAGLGEGLEGGGDLRYVGTVTFFFAEPSINLHNACALRPINARRGSNIFFFFSNVNSNVRRGCFYARLISANRAEWKNSGDYYFLGIDFVFGFNRVLSGLVEQGER